MNYLWAGMILLGILYGTLTGNLKAVTEAAVSSSKEAVTLCISMAGITAMWTGMMKIAETTGLVAGLSRRMRPVLRFLFPRISPNSRAGKYIALNFLSNLLGLGWAATPAGLTAMEELAKLEEERRKESGAAADSADTAAKIPAKGGRQRGRSRRAALPGVASNEMCTFLIINVSSLQLVPMNMIAYRAQYGSVNPAAIVGPSILATAVSTAVAVTFCKVMDGRGRRA